LGSSDALTLSYGLSSTTQADMNYIVLGAGFFSANAAQQQLLLIHELLHVVAGSHQAVALRA
jgi:hypothetical protein